MIALGLVLAVAAACGVAAICRLGSAPAFALAVYLLTLAEIVLIVEALSIVAAVRMPEVLIAEVIVLLGVAMALLSGCAWSVPRAAPLRSVWVEISGSPPVVLMLFAVAAALVYELALGLLTPPNNWDSMAYHLSRAAGWYQHHGVSYLDAPTERENEPPPNAEILALFTFVFAHGDRWAAAWQWLAGVASMIAIYTVGRHIGFARPAALFAALLFASLSQTVLQSSTTQNDLLTASFVMTAVAFLSTSEGARLPLAALALGLAVGTKLSVVFALPAVAVIAGLLLPRREWIRFGALVLSMIVAVGAFGYALNLAHTGSPLGTPCATVGFCQHSWLDRGKTVVGIGVDMALDLRLSPGWPPNEDDSYYGPLGAALVIPVVVLTLLRWRRGQVPPIHAALAAAFPLYIVLLALSYHYNPWIGRFMVIPAALVAPLFGTVLRTPRYAVAVVIVAVVTLASASLFNHAKPSGIGGQPSIWTMTRTDAQTVQRPGMQPVLETLRACVPADARIGWVLNGDDWDFPLYGDRLSRTLVPLARVIDRKHLPATVLRDLSWALVRPGIVTVPSGWTTIRFRESGLDLLARTPTFEAASAGCLATAQNATGQA